MSKRWHFKSVHYTGQESGPSVIVLGAVHGNETCGTRAIEHVMAQLDSGALRVLAGSVTFVPVANALAYARGERVGERNLNRNLTPKHRPRDFEDRIANWLCPLLARHDVLLDLHSFNAEGAPFVMLGPRNNSAALEPFAHERQERALAQRLGVCRAIEGWLPTYARGVQRRMGLRDRGALALALGNGIGTTEYMRTTGGYGLTLECGQHDDRGAPEVAYRAIMNTLAFLGLIDAPAAPAPAELDLFSMAEVVDRDSPNDALCRDWSSFDRVRQGEEIGKRADGMGVIAPFDGVILFPDSAAAAGSEWFYLARLNPATAVSSQECLR